MEQYLQLGAIAIIFALAIREFFSYLKSRKNGDGKKDNKQDVKLAIIETKLTSIMENHLPHIEKRLDNIEKKLDILISK